MMPCITHPPLSHAGTKAPTHSAIIDTLQSHTHQPMLLVKRNVIASVAACTRTKALLRVKKKTK
jgi:hypothetical protein